MAGFLRARQAGIQNDLSAGIDPGAFNPDELARYGINSQISCVAYDPTQSLLAIGTSASQYGPSKIYVFGRSRVLRTFTPTPHPPPPTRPSSSSQPQPHHTPAAVRYLAFVANRLVSLDAHHELAVWDLDTGQHVARSTYSGRAACPPVTDPGLDWAFVGVHTAGGEICAFDLDRGRQVPSGGFKLPNFWAARASGGRGGLPPGVMGNPAAALVGMQMHPRDIGKLLIAYAGGAVVYSFRQDAVTKVFEYVLPEGAPGGDGRGMQRPRVVQAVWHPTGTFVLTAHEDGTLVFWDEKDGRVVAARSVYDTRVNEKGRGGKGATAKRLAPFGRIKWCCKRDPDDTALLIAGGKAVDDEDKGLTFLELGPTPTYATSSWDVLARHFDGKKQGTLPIPPGAEVADYCLAPRSSPFFDGAQDPIAVLVTLTSGELLTLTFPSGYPISPTNMLHPDMSFVHPFVQKIAVSTMPREKWLTMVEVRDQGHPILLGGAPAGKRRKSGWDFRNIVQVAHADSTIRIWDVGFDDDIENPTQLQVDVARALDRFQDVEVTALAMADATGELAAGTKTGEVVVYRWGLNRSYGRDAVKPLEPNPRGLTDISSRAEPSLKDGLQPYVLYDMAQGAVSVVAVSDVGFVAVSSEGGGFAILDLRGPGVVFQGEVGGFVKEEKRGSFLKGHSSKAPAVKEFVTVIEFGVMTMEGDGYSSIGCFVGTNLGHVATFKILPAGQTYSAQLAGVVKCGGERVVAVCPVNADNGQPAGATGFAVAGLREGKQVNGVLVVATRGEIRVFKPATAKGASRSFDDQPCSAARVTEIPRLGAALVAVFADRTTRAYSLPALKEIGRATLPQLDPTRTSSSVLTRTGEVLGWTGPSEIAVLPVWGAGRSLPASHDTLVNPQARLPPRPTISNLQWISGTQYVSPTDLDLLIGGENRPPSKRMMEAAAAERGMAGGGAGGGVLGGGAQEGWGEYLTRQINERTEKLNMVDDAMGKLHETSQGWSEEVSKYVKKQKRDVLLGGVKKSLF
ncbi:lethal giant larvae like, C-terminal-domain-containing protein [Staphylotrichum tortipilum]|uniref:Lethal giant larvae like, C-terminal-domain-containing protein n=1 Tax=Staphylotrichum tortipilum TaxID=2831512 RepID=A0AAN6RVL2_9PEZI|nr:lethal giant larvae like, C-terminal-domain-containing protein [Staphylotrichum longicolle]